MTKMMNKILNKLIRNAEGQALPMVLILMAVGGLIIAPLLSYTSSGLKVGQVYEEIAAEFYAADGGVEDGLWQIKYDHLDDLFGSYDPYNYTTQYKYPASYPVVINGISVTVGITNVWIPQGLDKPISPDYARQLIGAGKLIITGNVSAELTQQIKVYYYKEGSDAPLVINTLGIWLPPGFSYDDTGECNLETWMDANYKDYIRDITPHCGGQAVVWTFLETVLFTDLPGASEFDYPMTSIINFNFISSQPGRRSPEALSWMTTSGVGDIPYTWDADVKIYHIESKAGGDDGTIIDAYAIKSELRELGSAISGDYCATGGTLMTTTTNELYRNRLFKESSATIATDDIPSSAQVDAAYLYWSGWIEEAAEEIIWEDDCSNMSKWIPGSDWQSDGGRFRGHHTGSNPDKYLTMVHSRNLSSYVGETVIVSWNQSIWRWRNVDPSDCLKFEFSKNGGSTWGGLIPAFCGNNPSSNFTYVIPTEYLTENFKMRFYLDGFSGSNEYCYIDNIKISVAGSPVESAKVNRVMFNEPLYDNPNDAQIYTDEWQVEPTPDAINAPDSWAYSCFYDATELVKQLIADGKIESNGSGTYTLGHWLEDGTEVYEFFPTDETGYPLGTPAQNFYESKYEWAYAGWSLIIIYSSPETKGHQLYLFDDFHHVPYKFEGTDIAFSISGFLAPDDTSGSHLTCFIGEGDDCKDGDSLKINTFPLPRAGDPYDVPSGLNPQNNVWNGYSNAIDNPHIEGIDIDNFDMSDCIEPGATSAEVILTTDYLHSVGSYEQYNLIYIILSFRSETIMGGTVTYLVRG